MRFLVMLLVSILTSSANASGVLKCHDTYSPAQAKTTLEANIVSATQLSDVVIVPGPMLPMSVNSLKISNMDFKPVSRYGIETFVTWAEAVKYQADLPPVSNYKANFSVIFNLGSKWYDNIEKYTSSIVAQILFYPDDAGGTGAFRSNMYCELH